MKRTLFSALVVCAILILPRIALAHAHLVSSTPAENAAVQGPAVSIELRFNSRVDSVHSTLGLTTQGETVTLLRDTQRTETTLNAHATLKPGSYKLTWQALAPDGHLTRGEIPFTVR